MSWLISLCVALLAGAIAFGGMIFVCAGFVEWFHITSREGASGYFMVLLSLLGGLVGALVGLIVARQTGGGLFHQILWAGGVNLALCALVAGAGYLFGDHRAPDAGPEHAVLEHAYADLGTEREVRVQAEFDAIPEDAPIGSWFPYTGEGGNEARRATALRRIRDKPGHVAELSALMTSSDPREAVEALRIATLLPKPIDPSIKEAVASCGRGIANRIRQVNAAPAGDDPGFERAGEAGVLFNAWIRTARALREPENRGDAGDFVPELREILDLSRARPDIHVVRQDILRVASYHADKWAGIAPLPDDPPPH